MDQGVPSVAETPKDMFYLMVQMATLAPIKEGSTESRDILSSKEDTSPPGLVSTPLMQSLCAWEA